MSIFHYQVRNPIRQYETEQSNIVSSFFSHKVGQKAALAEVKEGPSELQIKSENALPVAN